MKKPEIEKRLLPLLDIIFLLLCFFIVLPHGIKSNEILEIASLRNKNQELDREVAFYRWQHGPLQSLSGKSYRARMLTLSRGSLYWEGEQLAKEHWERKVTETIESIGINFVVISGDAMDQETTIADVRRLEKILSALQIPYIITYEHMK